MVGAFVLESQAQLVMRPGPILRGPAARAGELHPSGDRGAFAKNQGRPRPAARIQRPARQVQPHAQDTEKADYDQNLRQSTAQKLSQLGVELDWSRHTRAELEEIMLKVKASNQLKEFGANWSWYTYSLPELQYELRRREKIKELEGKGVPLEWGKMSLGDLIDIENRIKQAQRVSKLGRQVDWQSHSLAELKEMEAAYYRVRRE